MEKIPEGEVEVFLQELQKIEKKINSRYVSRENKIPDDPIIIEALRQLADAWGNYSGINQKIVFNEREKKDVGEAMLMERREFEDMENEARDKIGRLLPRVQFYKRPAGLAVLWNGGSLELSSW